MNEEQARQKRIKDSMRFISGFGQREMEVAAIIIFDNYATRPMAAVDPSIFKDEMERSGFEELKEHGWLSAGGIPTDRFWRRCFDAASRDDAKQR